MECDTAQSIIALSKSYNTSMVSTEWRTLSLNQSFIMGVRYNAQSLIACFQSFNIPRVSIEGRPMHLNQSVIIKAHY